MTVDAEMVERALAAKVADGEDVRFYVEASMRDDNPECRRILATEVIGRALEAALATPSPVEAQREDGWISVTERMPDDEVLVMVYVPDSGDGERFDFDFCEEGVWHDHAESFDHFMAVGGANAGGPDCICIGPSEEAPYTHWRELRPPSAAPAPSVPPAGVEGLDSQYWEVEVRVSGESVLTIGHNHLSGIPNIDDYADTVRKCGDHLLSFIGAATPAVSAGDAKDGVS